MTEAKTWNSKEASGQQLEEFAAVLHAIDESLKNGIRHLNFLNAAPAANYDLKETLKTMSVTVESLEKQASDGRLKLFSDTKNTQYSIRNVHFFVSRDVRREGFLAFFDPDKKNFSEEDIIREMLLHKLCVKSVAQQIISLDYTPDVFIELGEQHEMLIGQTFLKNFINGREFRIYNPPEGDVGMWKIEYFDPRTKIWEMQKQISQRELDNIEDVIKQYIPGDCRILSHWVLRWETKEGGFLY